MPAMVRPNSTLSCAFDNSRVCEQSRSLVCAQLQEGLMSDGKDPTTENRAQLEHFLSWRRANFRRRAARRRQWFRYFAVVSLAVIGVALVTWVTERARDARGRVTFERRQAPPESVAASSHDSAPPARRSAPP